MKCDELKRFDIVGKYSVEDTMYEFRPDGECYDADEVDAAIAELKAENRKLKRALWLSRALRARDIQRWWIAATCAPITERACSVWNNVERKCRSKAEQYKEEN